MTINENQWYEEREIERIISNEFDNCILGQCNATGNAIYSMKLIIEYLLLNGDYDDPVDAIDYIGHSMTGLGNGENTPIMLRDID